MVTELLLGTFKYEFEFWTYFQGVGHLFEFFSEGWNNVVCEHIDVVVPVVASVLVVEACYVQQLVEDSLVVETTHA